MNFDKDFLKKWREPMIFIGFFLVILYGIGWYHILSNNNVEKTVTSFDIHDKVFLKLNPNNQIDCWKTNMQLTENSDEKVIMNGETFSLDIHNDNKFDITNWKLLIKLKQECYLNGFWCGSVEVHQFRDGEEVVELLPTSKCDISKLTVENNNYSNNLMVRLLPDDYLVYYPSSEAKEDIIHGNAAVGIGFILYYKDIIDLSGYELSYYNNQNWKNIVFLRILLVLFIIWFILLVFFHGLMLLKRSYRNEINDSIRSISAMAELYHEVHMINLKTKTGYLIKGNSDNLLFDFIGKKITDVFALYIIKDCQEDYKTELTHFLDVTTIAERMKTSASITCEYISNKYGWTSLRFFKTDKNVQVNHVIIAVQDINEEKKKQAIEQELLKRKEFSHLLRSSFLDNITQNTEMLLQRIIDDNRRISESVSLDENKELSADITNCMEHYKLLRGCIFDMFDLESDTFKLRTEQYNFYDFIENILSLTKTYYMNKDFVFLQSIDSDIPPILEGDKLRLMQIIMLILVSSFFVTEKGYVKFSVCAKNKGEYEEMVFSVRDTAQGFTEGQMKEIQSVLAGSEICSFENPSLAYLKLMDTVLKYMDSELKVVSVFGSGSDFYFSVKQKIVQRVE